MGAVLRQTAEAGTRRRTPLSRRFTLRYALAVLLFGGLAALTLATVSRSLDEVDAANSAAAAATHLSDSVVKVMLDASTLQDLGETDPAVEPELDRLRSDITRLDAARLDEALSLPSTTASALKNLSVQAADYRLRYSILDAATRVTQYRALFEVGQTALERIDTYQAEAREQISTATDHQGQVNIQLGLMWGGIAAIVVLFIFRPMARSIRSETSQLEQAERMQRENNERQTFRNDTKQALENTENEEEVMGAVGRAMLEVVPSHPVELMLVDSSRTHLHAALAHPTQGSPSCPVDSPGGCAALRRGQPLVFESSRMLNVCPKLPLHGDPCSAVCVPVTFMSESLGVLHLVGPDGIPPTSTEIERLKVLGVETGNRIGTMRAMRATQLQADTDGLTGLLNRRSLETQARKLLNDGYEFSLAIADLDHFKSLNDTHGHEMGDRALRLFAKTLRANLRPDDIAARYGGEEFVVILPSANIRESQRALERLQVKLAADIAAAHSVPPFTASWGLTDTSAGDSLAEVLAVADAALYDAKRNGRNCIVVDGEAVNTLVRQQGDTGLTGALLAGFPEAPRPPVERDPMPEVEEERLTRFDRDSGRPAGSRPIST